MTPPPQSPDAPLSTERIAELQALLDAYETARALDEQERTRETANVRSTAAYEWRDAIGDAAPALLSAASSGAAERARAEFAESAAAAYRDTGLGLQLARDQAQQRAAAAEAGHARLAARLEEIAVERDAMESAVQDCHLAAGGDGEWSNKHDLKVEAPALVRELQQRAAAAEARVARYAKALEELSDPRRFAGRLSMSERALVALHNAADHAQLMRDIAKWRDCAAGLQLGRDQATTRATEAEADHARLAARVARLVGVLQKARNAVSAHDDECGSCHHLLPEIDAALADTGGAPGVPAT